MGLPWYLILNLVGGVAEWHGDPDPEARTYRRRTVLDRDGVIHFPVAQGEPIAVPVAELLPAG